ncbi:MAG: hypothetical protein ACE5EE_10800 [Fidelibacterota bacterium]
MSSLIIICPRWLWLMGVLVISLASSSFGKNLSLLSRYNSPNHELLDVEIDGNYAYVPAGLGGLNIINISDPENPFAVAEYFSSGCEFGRTYAWTVRDGYAYGSGRLCGIDIVDVSNPSNPAHVTRYGDGAGFTYEHTDISEFGIHRYLIAAAHVHGVDIVNVTSPELPNYVTTVGTDNAWAVEVSEDNQFVYVADGASGIKVIDISNPQDPTLLTSAQTSGTAKDVIVSGDYLFVAVGAAGVDMFDISVPDAPYWVANYNTSGYASRVAVSGNRVAVSDWDDVEILQWDDAPSLSLVGYKNTGGRVMAINMMGDYVYSAEWRYFRIFQFGEIEEADIDFSFRSTDFLHTAVEQCRDTSLVITNSGGTALEIEDFSIDHEDFILNLPTNLIPAGQSVTAQVQYCATSENGTATLSVNTNDPDEPSPTVRLKGNTPYGVEAGELAPDFTLPVVNGTGEITLSELTQMESQIVVVAFFASW